MIRNRNWDTYFYSHYKPIENEWGGKDLNKYKRWYSTWINFIVRKFNFKLKGKSALELGCGIGAFSSLLHDKGCRITGSDISQKMVHVASSVNPEIPFIVHDILSPSISKNHFDYVFAFEVLEHLFDSRVGIHNIHTMISKNGWFIGSSPYPYKKNMKDPTHINVHLPAYWKKLFIEEGFDEVRTIPMSFLPFLWRYNKYIHFVLPCYISFPFFVSTTLIVTHKKKR